MDRNDVNPPAFDGEEEYVPSPCENVCVLDDKTGYCLGCRRTIEEIMEWGVMAADEKRRVLEEIEHRRLSGEE